MFVGTQMQNNIQKLVFVLMLQRDIFRNSILILRFRQIFKISGIQELINLSLSKKRIFTGEHVEWSRSPDLTSSDSFLGVFFYRKKKLFHDKQVTWKRIVSQFKIVFRWKLHISYYWFFFDNFVNVSKQENHNFLDLSVLNWSILWISRKIERSRE